MKKKSPQKITLLACHPFVHRAAHQVRKDKLRPRCGKMTYKKSEKANKGEFAL